jgi:hypothetical protein
MLILVPTNLFLKNIKLKNVLIQDFLKQMKPIKIEQSLNYFHYDMYMKQKKRMF